jgi:hypothetical protein
MKKVSLTFYDNNYTAQAKTDLSLDPDQMNNLKTLLGQIEGHLLAEDTTVLAIENLLQNPVHLTITNFGDEHGGT